MARQTLDPDLPESDALLDTWRQAVPGKALRTAPRSISASHVPPVAMSTLPLTPLTSIQDAQAVGIPSLPHTSLVPSSAWNFEPRVDGDDEEPSGLLSALAWGMIAGLILNVMPCVLPVLTLKMSALLHAAGERTERIRRFREHNLFFAAGVLTWFCILALAVSLLGLTWGGLFQFPFLVAALAVLMCLLALSMLDICTLPVIDLKAGTSGSPRSQAFLTGLTATLLATPCSGPLLGGVLAWSAMQPPHIALIVFLGVGLGMSLPYLMFSLWPHTVSLLPRPGAWLLVLERIVGIFLLGTTMYLLVLLPRTWAPVLAAILTLVAGVMTWQHAARFRLSRPSARTVLTLLCGVALTGCLLALGGSESVTLSESEQFRQGSSPWEQFTPEAFSRALGSEPIVLQFTADWYPNCKVLEMTTLQSERMRRLQQRYGLRLFIVDMTESDPDQERLLRSLKSISIPLTALFAPGAASHEPVILRDTYMPSRLEAALATLLKDGS